MNFYILKDKVPVLASSLEWAQFSNDHVQCTVAEAKFDGGVIVLTTFTGLDVGNAEGPPLLFTTRVFDGEFDGEIERTSTYSQAEAMHAQMIARVKGGS